jgi:hypothetical protein
MTKRTLLLTLPLLLLAACGEGQEGDPCTTDEDCAEGLICHDHAEEEHEHEEDEEEHEHEEEAGDGVCEPPDAHDDEHEDDTGE